MGNTPLTLIDYLFSNYHAYDCREVSDCIEGKPDIFRLLYDAITPIHEIFGLNTCMNLRIIRDHDDDDSAVLIVGIRSLRPVKESIALLRRFDEEWWMNQTISRDLRLVIDLDV